MISIVIVHHNTPHDLQQLLSQITNHSFQIIVIDNASDDQSALKTMQSTFTQVQFIMNKINGGYARACNQGAAAATGTWLTFLNPDIQIGPSAIIDWCKQMEEKGLDASSPIPIDIKRYAKPLPTPWNLLLEFSFLNRYISLSAGKKTLTGGALMIQKSVFDELGGFDERFFLWFEDSDLSQRLYNVGYSVGWLDIPHQHTGGVSFHSLDEKQKRHIFFHSMQTYASVHFDFWGRLIVRLIKKRYTNARHLLPVLRKGVTLIVPNARYELLLLFLKHNDAYKKGEVEIMVVSSDLSRQKLWHVRKQYPHIRFIPLLKNRGFTSTVNIGLRVSVTDGIGTVNDDTEAQNDWTAACVGFIDNQTGSINPVILRPDGSIESAGITILKKGKALPQKNADKSSATRTDATNAAAVIYSHAALEKTGLFDERFGSYLEDIDLALRMSRNGFHHLVVNGERVIHVGHQTSSQTLHRKKCWLDAKNWILIILKNWNTKDLGVYFPSIFLERLRNVSGALRQFARNSKTCK